MHTIALTLVLLTAAQDTRAPAFPVTTGIHTLPYEGPGAVPDETRTFITIDAAGEWPGLVLQEGESEVAAKRRALQPVIARMRRADTEVGSATLPLPCDRVCLHLHPKAPIGAVQDALALLASPELLVLRTELLLQGAALTEVISLPQPPRVLAAKLLLQPDLPPAAEPRRVRRGREPDEPWKVDLVARLRTPEPEKRIVFQIGPERFEDFDRALQELARLGAGQDAGQRLGPVNLDPREGLTAGDVVPWIVRLQATGWELMLAPRRTQAGPSRIGR